MGWPQHEAEKKEKQYDDDYSPSVRGCDADFVES